MLLCVRDICKHRTHKCCSVFTNTHTHTRHLISQIHNWPSIMPEFICMVPAEAFARCLCVLLTWSGRRYANLLAWSSWVRVPSLAGLWKCCETDVHWFMWWSHVGVSKHYLLVLQNSKCIFSAAATNLRHEDASGCHMSDRVRTEGSLMYKYWAKSSNRSSTSSRTGNKIHLHADSWVSIKHCLLLSHLSPASVLNDIRQLYLFSFLF